MKKSAIALELVNLGLAKSSKEYRQAYRRRYHELNKEVQNARSLKRYHSKYKLSTKFKKQKKDYWAKYLKRMGPEWVKARAKARWQMIKSDPLKHAAFLKAHSKYAKEGKYYARWYYGKYEQSKISRAKLARKWRRKRNPAIGLRAAIREAKRTGDLGQLIKELSARVDALD